MNRNKYFDYIEEKLTVLATRVSNKGKLNLLDLHGHSENFYLEFFNLLYNWKLINMNAIKHNVEAIDLIDNNAKVILQVSATCTTDKIQSSLDKPILKNFTGYNFHFISIAKNASNLRNKVYSIPAGISFPSTNIHDPIKILEEIRNFSATKLKEIYLFIKDELGNEIDMIKMESNIAAIINFIAKEDWSDSGNVVQVNSFEIERKIKHNSLNNASSVIKEYSIYQPKIDAIYSEFDKRGLNKSKSVLSSLNREYLKHKGKETEVIFNEITSATMQKIIDSSNFDLIPIDELELCVDLLIVDAFIRCKIFENPIGYTYANA